MFRARAGRKPTRRRSFPEEDEDETAEELPKEQKLPELKKGEKLKIEKTELTAGKTKPPARFNEATLLSAMENPVKYMEIQG